MLPNGTIITISDDIRLQLTSQLEELANQGFRVIGCAYRELGGMDFADHSLVETDLVFVGFLSFIDPPRPEVFDALQKCYTAGINVLMITGDHPQTAQTIARQLGIANNDKDNVLTGTELSTYSDEELLHALDTTKVFARVSPAHKLRLVTLLKDQGEILSMTGDGINDSPALAKADIGVAMGIAGTDAAKEASDMILLDDNFSTLVDAIEDGRTVNNNIRKFTNYLLASNTSEVALLILGFFVIAAFQPLLIRDLIPLSETQILYLNLVSDSFLALALGLERRERNVMEKPPLKPDTPIVTYPDLKRIVMIGITLSILGIVTFFIILGDYNEWSSLSHNEVAHAQSFVLTLLVLSEVLIAFSYKSKQRIREVGFFSNWFLILSAIIILVSQVAILYTPLFNNLFDTQPLTLFDWLIIIPLSFAYFILIEITKRETS